MFFKRSLSHLPQEVADFLLQDFNPHYGRAADQGSEPAWQRMRDAGSELWLDTGNIADISQLWTREFSAVTTNNTLLNKEVQSGQYDDFVHSAAELLSHYRLNDRQWRLEMAFILNAHHALRLVSRFDAFVSVEEHTDLAFYVDDALAYARRYYALCPERFFVKIPFTPAGLLATRLAAREGIPVNHTLGFSARQNYVIARLAQPRFVNVFLGRLNSFVADNRLGDGLYVGEKATLASQHAIAELRRTGLPTRQIGASFRAPQQVRDLCGLDVLTMPASVARGFLDLRLPAADIVSRLNDAYEPQLADLTDDANIDTLWNIPPRLVDAVDELDRMDLDDVTPGRLVEFFHSRGCGDFMVKWTPEQINISSAEGKIPRLENWLPQLRSRAIGLDSLLNLAGLQSFVTDQRAMDERVQQLLQRQVEHHST